jgi:hypothetical protein
VLVVRQSYQAQSSLSLCSRICPDARRVDDQSSPPEVGSKWHLMAGHGEKFGRKQEEAIAALLTQCNVEEPARSRDWSQDPPLLDPICSL